MERSSMIQKFGRVYKLLADQRFKEISNTLDNDFKCIICKKILINAYQGICGCSFCQKCLENYISNGGEVCPGNTEECKLIDLSIITVNHGLNRKISKLIVKCPYELCYDKCQLIDMSEHMRFCPKQDVKCPFYEHGCSLSFVHDKLNEHLQLDIYSHSKILIEMIENLKNEVSELRLNEQKNNQEIKILKEKDNIKSRKIESMKNEIESIKGEKDELFKEVELLKKSLYKKIDIDTQEKFEDEKIELINGELRSIKIEKEELAKKMETMRRNIDDKIDVEMSAKLSELSQDWRFNLENEVEKLKKQNEKTQNEFKTYLNRIKCDGLLEWKINEINKIKENADSIFSEDFSMRMNPYKMRLKLYAFDNELSMWLFMYPGEFDEDLKWPLKAQVTIKISNEINPDECKIMTKPCRINKPPINTYKSSDEFKFYYSELTNAGLMKEGICCVVECLVKF